MLLVLVLAFAWSAQRRAKWTLQAPLFLTMVVCSAVYRAIDRDRGLFWYALLAFLIAIPFIYKIVRLPKPAPLPGMSAEEEDLQDDPE